MANLAIPKKMSERKHEVYEGARFGRLLVLHLAKAGVGKKAAYKSQTRWDVICDCGNLFSVYFADLLKSTKSCGCIRKDISKQTDLKIGDKIKEITIVSDPFFADGRKRYHCICACGRYTICSGSELLNNKRKTCGKCKVNYVYSNGIHHNSTHGMSRRTEYNIWVKMKDRCYRQNVPCYNDYGGRGIKVCERWLESFQNFYADMGDRPKGKTLDRIDVNGNYEPKNCKWSDLYEQARNKRNTVLFPYKGKMITRSEAARLFGLDVSYVCGKIKRPGMTMELIEQGMRKPIAKR